MGMKRPSFFSLFLASFLILSLALPHSARADDMWSKLGRGGSNLLLCPLEIPMQMSALGKTERAPVAFIGGAGKGLLTGARRGLIGLYEIFTFPFPGKKHYEPILEPEFVLPEYFGNS